MKDQRRARPSQPSARKNAPGPVFIRFPDVTLTSEEQEECDVLVSSVFRADEQGYWALHEGAAEPITRNLIAMCLMSRAERLAWDADDNVEARALALESAAKACTVYPLSVYFFDFATLLERLGAPEDAKVMFREFLRRYEQGPIHEADASTLQQRKVEAMVLEAKSKLQD